MAPRDDVLPASGSAAIPAGMASDCPSSVRISGHVQKMASDPYDLHKMRKPPEAAVAILRRELCGWRGSPKNIYNAKLTLGPGEAAHLRAIIVRCPTVTKRNIPLLVAVHEAIDGCRVCAREVAGFRKPPHLERGDAGKVMIIGQGPGNAEMRAEVAFAGQSGKTLNSWLVAAGADRDNPREGIYFTSVIKCCAAGPEHFRIMERNCRRFLRDQIAAIEPALIITLGKEAYMAMRFTNTGYDRALCKPVHSSDHLLYSWFGFHFWLLPWPHPSGLNRWHNVPKNRERLRESFEFVQSALEGAL
jgi:uracil-DNA glycosylase family 4